MRSWWGGARTPVAPTPRSGAARRPACSWARCTPRPAARCLRCPAWPATPQTPPQPTPASCRRALARVRVRIAGRGRGVHSGLRSTPAAPLLPPCPWPDRRLRGATPSASLPPSCPAAVAVGDLKLLKSVGAGSFGEVWRAQWQGTTVAVKMFSQVGGRGAGRGGAGQALPKGRPAHRLQSVRGVLDCTPPAAASCNDHHQWRHPLPPCRARPPRPAPPCSRRPSCATSRPRRQ